MIEIKNLNYGYTKKNNLYSNLSLTINQGNIVGLLGNNGAGKSTLLKLICGVLLNKQNSITTLGVNPNKRYAEMSAGEKIVIDKRISKLPASRLNAMARKLLPSVKTAERARKTHAKKESVSLSSIVDNNLNEATMWGQRQGKRPHMLLDKDNKPKFDKRFRMYKPKMEESVDDFDEILNLLETTEDYVSSEQGREDMQSFKENTRLKLINKIKNSGVVKSGSMSKDAPVAGTIPYSSLCLS